jgi:salicylate hydroxylase
MDDSDCVEAEFENGARVTVDVLVGADGIHSDVRSILFGPQEPRFTGCACYRGLVPADRLRHLNLEVTAQVFMGPGKHFVHYYVRDRRLVNFVALIEQPIWTGESWTDTGNVIDALALYDGWHNQVLEIMSAVDETFIWAVFERAPLQRWSVGRVTLLGDACHAMVPFLAQGAAQAIEDGATLAGCLTVSGGRDILAALQRYEAIRLPRTSRVQAASMANKARFHLEDGSEQEERDRLMATGSTDWSNSAIAWIYGHDASTLEAPA